ncbi:MAG: hypothetical protein E7232_09155 [Lachnospiraceae bacterium]|jgi:DNA-directed RNA polymerase subunit RPC12/RpoP|nr:hypothetical protein [Lachnospiraceae bacterium]
MKVLPGFNDLQTTDPELAKEYSPNNERPVAKVRKSLQVTALWLCSTCSGEYPYMISNRQLGDHVCPYCNGTMLLKGFNSLADVNPVLAKRISPLNDKPADEILPSKATIQLWRCSDCGGDYSATTLEMEDGYTCPYCDDRKLLKGFNSFGDRHPELLSELYELGNALMGRSPFTMLSNSTTKLSWQCPKDVEHTYLMSPSTRLMFQKRDREPCLYCRGQRRKKNHYINYNGWKKKQNSDT